MSLKSLLANRTLHHHPTSPQEIQGLRQLIERDLGDAQLEGLSNDRQFATAYNAVLQVAKMAMACAGYRVGTGAGHHQKSFEAVKYVITKKEVEKLADYFEICRRKRNTIEYDAAEIVTETESQELLTKAIDFRALVEDWITQNYPTYSV